MSERAARRGKVWDLLLTGGWHQTTDIASAEVGGTEGMRRLRELREECRDGHREGFSDIENRTCDGGTQWEYSLIPNLVTEGSLF